MVNLLAWLLAGVLAGWIASLLLRAVGAWALGVNIMVGIVGALLAGWLVAPLLAASAPGQNLLSLDAIAVALLGAMLLLAIVALLRRGRLH